MKLADKKAENKNEEKAWKKAVEKEKNSIRPPNEQDAEQVCCVCAVVFKLLSQSMGHSFTYFPSCI
jgi:hypothetical protein